MKYDNVHCLEPGDGNAYVRPLEEEPKQSSTCEVFRLNPDGTKGEHLRTDPGFPEGWDNPTRILPQKPKPKEEESMPKKIWTKKPSNEGIAKTWEDCKHNISAVAKEYSVTWVTAKGWLIEAGLMEAKPKKDYFGTPIINPETTKQKPEQEPEIDDKRTMPEPIPTTKAKPDPMSEELAKLKLDFANLVLASMLGNTMKLKAIEYIMRM